MNRLQRCYNHLSSITFPSQVTVWALPRMEDVPVLTCSLHPKNEKDEEDLARALTPTKNISMGSVSAQNSDGLVLPGKHR